jgi:hypothetical protein
MAAKDREMAAHAVGALLLLLTVRLEMDANNVPSTTHKQRHVMAICGTKINSSDPPLTAVYTAYATPPFLLLASRVAPLHWGRWESLVIDSRRSGDRAEWQRRESSGCSEPRPHTAGRNC